MRLVGALGAALVLAACTPRPAWTPRPIETVSATPSAPGSPSGSPSGSASGSASRPAFSVPDASGAINADGGDSASFASPTGRIWCALYPDWVLCHFPAGMDDSRVPGSEEVCPGEGLDVTGVGVREEAAYFCSGGAEALPQTSGEYVGWWKGKDLPAVRYQGQRLAVLPYGRKLARGDYVCLSEEAGVTCGNPDTGKGFRVARAGVDLIG